MRTLVAVLVVSLLLAACGPQTDVEAEKAAIESARAQWVAAYKSGDLDRMETLYTEDAVLLPAEAPAVSGKAGVAGWYERFFEQNSVEEISVPADEVVVAGEWAFVRGRAYASFRGRDAKSLSFRGKTLEIWRKQADGSWKWARAIWNSDEPPARPEPPAAKAAAAKPATTKPAAPTAVTAKPAAPKARFAVQAGAFEDRASADGLAARLTTRYGRKAEVAAVRVGGRTLYRVRIPVASEGDGKTLADRIRREQQLEALVVPLP